MDLENCGEEETMERGGATQENSIGAPARKEKLGRILE